MSWLDDHFALRKTGGLPDLSTIGPVDQFGRPVAKAAPSTSDYTAAAGVDPKAIAARSIPSAFPVMANGDVPESRIPTDLRDQKFWDATGKLAPQIMLNPMRPDESGTVQDTELDRLKIQILPEVAQGGLYELARAVSYGAKKGSFSTRDFADNVVKSLFSPRALAKSTYDVGLLASILCALADIQRSLEMEAEYEGDESELPAAMQEALRSFKPIFIALATEEINELIPDEDAAKRLGVGSLQKSGSGQKQIFARIAKVEEQADGTCIVRGIATAEEVDLAGEILDYSTAKPQIEKWRDDAIKRSGGKSLGNIRAMHGPVAAGIARQVDFDDAAKKVTLEAHVTDVQEAAKCITGTYTGFSIGGDYLKRWPDKSRPGVMRFTPSLAEISLVDSPCVESAVFTYAKVDGSVELRKFAGAQNTSSLIDEFTDAYKKRSHRTAAKRAGGDSIWNLMADCDFTGVAPASQRQPSSIFELARSC